MDSLSVRRFIFRIKKNLSRISKTALFAFVFLILLGGNISQVFADDAFNEYKYLFNTANSSIPITVGVNTNTFAKKSWMVDGQNISGIWMKYSYTFGSETGDKNAEYTWDHIDALNGSEIFIVRSCDTGTTDNCIYSKIPYTQYGYGTDTNIIFRARASAYFANQTVDIKASQWVTSSDSSIVPDFLTKPAQSVSIWYCASKPNHAVIAGGDDRPEPKDAADSANDPAIQKFGSLCDGRTYFKINQVDGLKPVSAQIESQTQATTTNEASGGAGGAKAEGEGNDLPSCSFTGGIFSAGSFMGCIARVVYYVVYWPIAWFASLMGNLFDFFLSYSLSDSSYRAEFAIRGWQIVRDISNIFFIVILVWTGLSTVFNTGTNMKKVVPNLILNALLINFSLFGTRVIIDISNIVARVFYNTMQVCEGKCVDANNDGVQDNPAIGAGKSKALSQKIVSAFNPQKIFDTSVIDSQRAVKNVTQSKIADSDSEVAGYYIVVTIIAAAILFGIAMMFWRVAFFFLGRVIGLYVAMIFAPFAFLGRGGLPLVSGIKELSWDSWLSDLTKYALLAPIFVFFLYIIYSFLETNFITVYTGVVGNTFFETVIYIAVPMLIVYFMVKQGVTIAENYAGKIGKQVQEGAMKVIGSGVGLAAGTAAFAGRNIIGRGLGAIGKQKVSYTDKDGKEIETTRAAQWAANSNNSFFARRWNNTYSASQTGSWDARNVNVAGKSAEDRLFKGLGLSDNISGKLGIGKEKALGKDGKAGGNVMINKKRDEEKQKEIESRIQTAHLSDEDAKAAGERYKNEKIKAFADQHWTEHVDVDDIALNSKAYRDLKTKEEQIQKDLVAAKAANLPGATAIHEQSLADNKTAQAQTLQKEKDTAKDTKEKDQAAFQQLKLQAVDQITKDNKRNESEAFKDTVKEERDRLDKYGKIKDNKSFTNMMRAEYVEDLQNGSFWGEFTKSGFGSAVSKTAIGSILGTLIPVLAPAVGTLLGGVFAKELADDLIDNATGSRSRAIKAIIKKATAAPGTGNTLVDLEARLQKHKDSAVDAINESLKTAYDSYDKILPAESKRGILKRIAMLDEDIENFTEEIKTLTGDKKIEARYNKAKAEDERTNLRNIEEKLARAQKDLDEKKDRENDKEERKKESNKPKTKEPSK